MKIAIIGAGRVGSCLAYLLKDKFEIIGLTSLYPEQFHLKGLKIFDQGKNVSLSKDADIIFITTPDDLIEKTANEIFKNEEINKKFVFHCSGCHPSSILKKAKDNNCFIGSIHPLQSVPNIEQGVKNLKKGYFCIEGDIEAIEIAKKIVNLISGKYFIIDTKYKPLYHLSAVFSSNFINTLIFTTCEIFKKIGINDDYNKIVEIISPLFTGTTESIKKLGPINSLTGPIVRGDIVTIEAHLNALNNFMPEIIELYKKLSSETVKIALNQVDELDAVEKIKKIKEIVR